MRGRSYSKHILEEDSGYNNAVMPQLGRCIGSSAPKVGPSYSLVVESVPRQVRAGTFNPKYAISSTGYGTTKEF